MFNRRLFGITGGGGSACARRRSASVICAYP